MIDTLLKDKTAVISEIKVDIFDNSKMEKL